MNRVNRVFGTLAGFRRGAYRLQRWVALLGLVGVPACLAGWAAGRLPAWSIAAAAGPLLLAAVWALAWRRLMERAFWRGARVPRRGRPVRLPLEVLLAAAGAWVLCGGAARAADPRLILRISEGREIDLGVMLEAAGIGGWIALAMGAVALLVSFYLLFSLWEGHFAPARLRSELLGRISAGDIAAARKLCGADSSLLARSVLAGLPESDRAPAPGRALPGARIEAAGRRSAARWKTLVDLLAAAGLLAPVAGLFGTALGLIDVFSSAAVRGSSSAWVAAGAVTALAPAVAALGASLFSLTAHYLADLRLSSLTARCEAACMECAAALDDAARASRERSGLTTMMAAEGESGEAG